MTQDDTDLRDAILWILHEYASEEIIDRDDAVDKLLALIHERERRAITEAEQRVAREVLDKCYPKPAMIIDLGLLKMKHMKNSAKNTR